MIGWGNMGLDQIKGFITTACTDPTYEINLNRNDLNGVLDRLFIEERNKIINKQAQSNSIRPQSTRPVSNRRPDSSIKASTMGAIRSKDKSKK